MTPTPPSLPQTLLLLAISRGSRDWMQPITRNSLVAKRWAVVAGTEPRRDGSMRDVFALTEAGKRALATSPHRAEAERKLEASKRSKPWQGLT